MKSVTTHYAKTHLSRLLRDVQSGEVVVIRNGAVPVARLVPEVESRDRRPRVGTVTWDSLDLGRADFRPMGDEELADWLL